MRNPLSVLPSGARTATPTAHGPISIRDWNALPTSSRPTRDRVRDAMTAATRTPPRILEIGEHRLMREAYPDTTEHWSTAPTLDPATRGARDKLVTLGSLPELARS